MRSNVRFLLVVMVAATLAATMWADVPDRTPPRGTVPNPGTQQQELANITFPAPYNVFEFVVTCAACHGGTIDQNAGHFGNWAGTSMASAARDPVFRANQIGVNNVIKAVTGEDGAGNICIRCHSPNAWMSGRFDPSLAGDAEGRTMIHSILASTDDEGILCEFCHRAIGNVEFERDDLDPADPAWQMLAGVSDWPHAGRDYLDQDGISDSIAAHNPLGDSTLQINDGMTYAGKYSGSVDIYASDVPLAGTPYTGQTYGVYPPGWTGPKNPVPVGMPQFNSAGQEIVYNPDGSIPIHFEAPIGPPLNPDLTYNYPAQGISLEHPTVGDRPDPLLPQPVPAHNTFLTTSEFCGSCHDLTVPILNHGMPEQRTYTEWKFSSFGDGLNGDDQRCQDCHMPTQKHEYADDVPVSLNPDPTLAGWFPYGKDRNDQGGTAFHKFAGANRDLPMMMKLLYPEPDLEVIGAVTGNDTRIFPGMLSTRNPMYDRAQRNSEIMLADAVDVEIVQQPTETGSDTGIYEVVVKVTNTSGHRIPSGYPDGRRFWIDLDVTDSTTGATVYESGYYDATEAELLTAPGVAFNRALEATIDATGGQPNAVMVYERVTGTCVDDTGTAIFPDPTAGTPVSCTGSPALTNNFILFDNRILPAGFDYTALRQAGVKIWNYGVDMVPYEDDDRFAANDGTDVVTYRFNAPSGAPLNARAEVYWQTHTREFMEHLRDQDTSTVRPEGPPSIFDPNYPLTPSYLSDVIGLEDIQDPYNLDRKGNPIPLNDNWGGIAYAAWLETGKGAPYPVAAADTSQTAPGTPPSNVFATPLDPFTLQVTWDPVDGAEGYLVRLSLGLVDATADWDKLAIVYDTSFTHEALNVGKSYRYTVQAFNGAGMGPESLSATGTTPIDLPLAPENLTAYWPKNTIVALSWLDVADNEVGFVIQRQDVPVVADFTTIATIPSQTAGGATGGNNYVDDTVKPGSTYNYRVAAYNDAGMSPWSLPVQTVTGGPPGAPTNLVAVLGAANSVDLSWNAATGTVDGYRVERSLDGVAFSALATVGPDALSYNDPTVLAGETYSYRVIAFNAVYDSLPSNVATVTVSAAAPGDPTNLVAMVSAGPTVDLTWVDNATDETGYFIERAQDPDPNTWTVIATTGPFDGIGTYSDAAVAPNETYHYRVQAFIDPIPVVSNYSNVATVTTPNQIPEAPSELRITKSQTKKLTIGWLDNSTNEDRFEVQRAPDVDGVPGTWAEIARLPLNSTSYADDGLTSATTYWYRVNACNDVGCSAWTAEVPGTTR